MHMDNESNKQELKADQKYFLFLLLKGALFLIGMIVTDHFIYMSVEHSPSHDAPIVAKR